MIFFFEAKCRIGLVEPPHYSKVPNFGVEDAPEAILTKGFLSQFGGYRVASFTFKKPGMIKKTEFNQVLAKSLVEYKDFINQNLEAISSSSHQKIIPVGIGGDHTIVLSSIMACLARGINPKNIGIIHFDSHGDINLSQESPTGNFHGMYLRPLFDSFDIPEIEQLVPNKIPIANLIMLGNLDLDPGEQDYLNKNRVPLFSREDMVDSKGRVQSKVIDFFQKFINSFGHIHISFDIDSLDKTIAPATGIPAENGLFLSDVIPFLELIHQHPSFSFDLCEVNPLKENSSKTIKTAQTILNLVLPRQ